MTDSTGTIRARYDYTPWGQSTKVSGDLESDFGFAGYMRDQATGQWRTYTRIYNADLARFTTQDPIGLAGGTNPYSYCLNNPVNAIDPSGLFSLGGWIMKSLGFDPDARYSISSIGAMGGADRDALLGDMGMSKCDFSKNLFAQAGGHLIDDAAIQIAIYAATAGLGVIIADLGKAAGEGSEEMATVFRGVNNESPAYSNALEGIANPRGTALDPVAHNAFDTANSGFTSWTTDLNTAVEFADNGGVVLRTTVPRSTLIASPDAFSEAEVLIKGPVTGAHPTIIIGK